MIFIFFGNSFFKMGQPGSLFHLILSFQTVNYFKSQQDLYSSHWSRRQGRCPLDYHRSPTMTIVRAGPR